MLERIRVLRGVRGVGERGVSQHEFLYSVRCQALTDASVALTPEIWRRFDAPCYVPHVCMQVWRSAHGVGPWEVLWCRIGHNSSMATLGGRSSAELPVRTDQLSSRCGSSLRWRLKPLSTSWTKQHTWESVLHFSPHTAIQTRPLTLNFLSGNSIRCGMLECVRVSRRGRLTRRRSTNNRSATLSVLKVMRALALRTSGKNSKL